MRKFFEKIVDCMEENGSIQPEYRDVYLFALQTVMVYVFNIGTGIIIGVWMKEILYCMIFLTAFVFLREEAGGYHAPGWKSCYFLSCGIVVLTLLWIKNEFVSQTYITVIAAGAAGIGIFSAAPLEDGNKPLEQEDRKIIRKKAQVIVVMELIIGMIFIVFDKRASYAVLSSVIWCGVSYLAWSVKKYTEKNEKKIQSCNLDCNVADRALPAVSGKSFRSGKE